MSDQRLRTLERTWQETNSVDDEEAYLRHALRRGVIDPDELELVSHLGHPAACRITAAPKRPPSTSVEALVFWTTRILARWGERPALRALVAQLRRSLGTTAVDPSHSAVVACDRTEAWLLCPCHDHRRLARGHRDAVEGGRREQVEAARWDRQAYRDALARTAASFLLQLVDNSDDRACKAGIREIVSCSTMLLGVAVYPTRWRSADSPLFEPALEPSELQPMIEDLKDAVRAELVPWVLERGDPLEQRASQGPRRYTPSERYEVDEPILHARFGAGVVRRVRGANIEVDFEGPTGLKTLRHKR